MHPQFKTNIEDALCYTTIPSIKRQPQLNENVLFLILDVSTPVLLATEQIILSLV